MAATWQKVLPHSVLPRAPSPNSTSPNPGVRSSITKFIAASPETSLDLDRDARQASSSNGEASSRLMAPPADKASRRGIARSTRILGVEREAQEGVALSQLRNGKVDVSFEATMKATRNLDKGKAVEHDHDLTLFDVDLEAANGRMTAPASPKRTRLFPFASGSTKSTAALVDPMKDDTEPLTDKGAKQETEEYDDEDALDNARLLGGSPSIRPGYFTPGDTSFAYNSLDDSRNAAIKFEGITTQEIGWMAVSSIFVIALVLVAVFISTDVIDWPGDGIGRQ